MSRQQSALHPWGSSEDLVRFSSESGPAQGLALPWASGRVWVECYRLLTGVWPGPAYEAAHVHYLHEEGLVLLSKMYLLKLSQKACPRGPLGR